MSSLKCHHCGTTEIDVDPSKGDAICTECGTVLESSAIVAEVQFEESAHGVSTAIGQFVSAESRGPRVFGTETFNYELLRESRERTREIGRKALNTFGKQLRLNQNCVDTSYNFFKLALAHNFTSGHNSTHVIGACLYLACRTEKAERLLIDCCDALQVHYYPLGRMYLKLCKTLRISIPPVDPCLYIMRFSSQLGFGEHQHAVSMTALRLVQRMKKDWLHIGRRQTGICGAALLLAARMHNFSRTVDDILKIVRVHECTLKKRLFEFGETPSGSLTFDEFMTIDLEEEQDPPCFKATKIMEQERLKKLIEDDNTLKCVTDLQVEIEKMLDKTRPTSCKFFKPIISKSSLESTDASRFTEESVATVINEYLDVGTTANETGTESEGLGPNIDCLNLSDSLGYADDTCSICSDSSAENDLNKGIDDLEINSYILTPWEINRKEQLWKRVNADYLQAQKVMEKRTPEKRRKKTDIKKSNNLSANTAGEAINKMLKKKKISNKINYDVLKDVNAKDFQSRPEYRKSVVPNLDEMEALQEYGDSSPLKQPSILQPNLLGHARVEQNTATTATYQLPSKDLAKTEETELEDAADFEDNHDHRSMNPAIPLHQLLRLHNNSPEPDWEYSEDYSDEEY